MMNWPVLMGFGIGQMGLAPDVFWSLTPAELQLMMGPAQRAGPLSRESLSRLMEAFPDDE